MSQELPTLPCEEAGTPVRELYEQWKVEPDPKVKDLILVKLFKAHPYVNFATCAEEDCVLNPCFGVEHGTHCAKHKKEDMGKKKHETWMK